MLTLIYAGQYKRVEITPMLFTQSSSRSFYCIPDIYKLNSVSALVCNTIIVSAAHSAGFHRRDTGANLTAPLIAELPPRGDRPSAEQPQMFVSERRTGSKPLRMFGRRVEVGKIEAETATRVLDRCDFLSGNSGSW